MLGSKLFGEDFGLENVATPTASSRKAEDVAKLRSRPLGYASWLFPGPRDSKVGTAKSFQVQRLYLRRAMSHVLFIAGAPPSVRVDLTKQSNFFVVHDLSVHVQAIQLCKRSFHGITTPRFILYRFVRTVRPS